MKTTFARIKLYFEPFCRKNINLKSLFQLSVPHMNKFLFSFQKQIDRHELENRENGCCNAVIEDYYFNRSETYFSFDEFLLLKLISIFVQHVFCRR